MNNVKVILTHIMKCSVHEDLILPALIHPVRVEQPPIIFTILHIRSSIGENSPGEVIMGEEEDYARRVADHDNYNRGARQGMMEDDAASQQVQIKCAQEILTSLMQHINEQLARYGKNGTKAETYTSLKTELQSLSTAVLLTKPDSENREQNIGKVIDIMKRTGEASQERRGSFWDSVYQFITGNKREVKSWTDFKNTISEVKDNIAKQREQLDIGPRTNDYAKELSTAAEQATQEKEDSVSQNKMS